MIAKMPYSVYKNRAYRDFRSFDYDPVKKTISVEIPDYKKPKFPADWRRHGNHYVTPNRCCVYFWNSGFAENFIVERKNGEQRSFPPSLYAREEVIKYVYAAD